jgi:competence protein ComEA
MLDWLQRYQWLVLAASFVLLAVAVASSSLISGSPSALEFRAGSGLPPGTPIKVQVSGAVLEPGVYQLREGDRVVDAIEAAGGPANDALIDSLNLARRVRDGERLDVPGQRGTTVVGLRLGEKVDINTAPPALLEALPGIGPAYARRIVDSRAVDGPYRTIDDLLERRVIPRSTFDAIRDLIAVVP